MKNINKTKKQYLNEIDKLNKKVARLDKYQTKHKQAEEALRESENKFKAFTIQSTEGITVADMEGNYTYVNPAFCDMVGWTEEELLQMTVFDMSATTIKKEYSIFKRTKTIDTGVPVTAILLRKNGEEFIGEITGQIIYIKDKKSVLGIIRDVTERKYAEKKLKKSEEIYRMLSEELTESNSMKELLLDILSHDLKNPASAIKGYVDLGIETDPDNEILQEIQSGINSLLKVVDNMKILSKVAVGDEIDMDAIDITEMIKTISKEFVTHLQHEKMKLDMKLKKKMVIKANPIISEVFRNYISNAIKHGSSGKKIIINAHEKDGIVTINATDNGDSIAEKDRENIFKRSIQLGKTKGSGLGLAIVKRIADAHKAEIGVKPNKPKGNIFYIKLPVS
jgi:PAS domain S-box-containing protein